MSVTYQEIAQKAGVSTCTVSNALRGSGKMAEATRARVLRVAEALGYQANSAASLLAQQRHRPGRTGRISIAALGSGSQNRFLTQACEQQGLGSHTFVYGDFTTPEECARVLFHRGIDGLILNLNPWPWGEAEWRRFDWSRFCVVKISRAEPWLACDLVRHSAFDYMLTTLRQVANRSFLRIVLLLHPSISEEDDIARLGAVLAFRDRFLPDGVLFDYRWLEGSGGLSHEDVAWIRRRDPDVVVGYTSPMIFRLRESGFDIPGKIKFAAILVFEHDGPIKPPVAGCAARMDAIYGRAVIRLRELILLNQRGFSENLVQTVIEPLWIEGETL